VDVCLHVFWASALVEGEWPVSPSGRFIPWEIAPCNHWIGGWVSLRTGLDDVKKRKILPLSGLELRSLVRPARYYSDCTMNFIFDIITCVKFWLPGFLYNPYIVTLTYLWEGTPWVGSLTESQVPSLQRDLWCDTIFVLGACSKRNVVNLWWRNGTRHTLKITRLQRFIWQFNSVIVTLGTEVRCRWKRKQWTSNDM
jgi:hypothetical protein